VIAGFRVFLCLLACGAIALPERIAPAGEGAPFLEADPGITPRAERNHGDDDKKQAPSSIKMNWHLENDSKLLKAYVNVSGVDPAMLPVLLSPRMTASLWASFFAVYVESESKPRGNDTPPVLGSYRVQGKVIQFEPRFPPESDILYRAVFDPVRLRSVVEELSPAVSLEEPKTPESRLTSVFSFSKQPTDPTTKITALYPSGDLLPENLLRFYIHFSAPMNRGGAYEHLRLIDLGTNKAVHAPFLELEEELWSPDGKRFTLLIDPGRIKRGLKPREMFGPVLEAGKSYSLVVDRDWIDAKGNPLESELRRAFRAGPADAAQPDPWKWKLLVPQAGTARALEARFPEPLDRALVERLLTVLDAQGRRVPGRVSISEAETIWRFAPEAPWRMETYRLSVGTELEDVAGNSIAAPFEVDMTETITKRVTADRVEIPFSPSSPPAPR
jgi:hypothetical protein